MKERGKTTVEDVQKVTDDEFLFRTLKAMARWDVTTDPIEDLEALRKYNPVTDPIIDDFGNPL